MKREGVSMRDCPYCGKEISVFIFFGTDIADYKDLKELSNTNTKNKYKSGGKFNPPTLEEVTTYCQQRNNSVDPEAFVAFYESIGWKVGNKPMKNWYSAIITWEKREEREKVGINTDEGVCSQPDCKSKGRHERYGRKYCLAHLPL